MILLETPPQFLYVDSYQFIEYPSVNVKASADIPFFWHLFQTWPDSTAI